MNSQAKSYFRSGFTLIEILAVLAILGVIAAFLMMAFKNYASFQQYSQAVNDVEFIINETRLSARSSINDESHGIKFNSNGLVVFVGDSYSAIDPQNKTFNYNLITLDVDLTNGVDRVVFNKLSGLPSATGTIVVSGANYLASTTIELTGTGVIQ